MQSIVLDLVKTLQTLTETATVDSGQSGTASTTFKSVFDLAGPVSEKAQNTVVLVENAPVDVVAQTEDQVEDVESEVLSTVQPIASDVPLDTKNAELGVPPMMRQDHSLRSQNSQVTKPSHATKHLIRFKSNLSTQKHPFDREAAPPQPIESTNKQVPLEGRAKSSPEPMGFPNTAPVRHEIATQRIRSHAPIEGQPKKIEPKIPESELRAGIQQSATAIRSESVAKPKQLSIAPVQTSSKPQMEILSNLPIGQNKGVRRVSKVVPEPKGQIAKISAPRSAESVPIAPDVDPSAPKNQESQTVRLRTNAMTKDAATRHPDHPPATTSQVEMRRSVPKHSSNLGVQQIPVPSGDMESPQSKSVPHQVAASAAIVPTVSPKIYPASSPAPTASLPRQNETRPESGKLNFGRKTIAPTPIQRAETIPVASPHNGQPMATDMISDPSERNIFHDQLSPASISHTQVYHGPTPHSETKPPVPAQVVIRQVTDAVVQTKDTEIEIQLNPQELGRVKLSLHSSDGQMSVMVATERPETLDLMRRHIELLRHEFRSLGYSSCEFSFGQRQGSQEQNPSQHQPSTARTAQEDAPNQHSISAAPGGAIGGLDRRI